MPPTRGASGWMKSARRWRISSPCSATLVSISPVAIGVSSERGQRGVALGVVGVERLLDPRQVRAARRRGTMRCAVARSHCWLASTISGHASPTMLAHRLARAAGRASRSGWPTLILMPPMPRSSESLDVLQHLVERRATGSRPRCCSSRTESRCAPSSLASGRPARLAFRSHSATSNARDRLRRQPAAAHRARRPSTSLSTARAMSFGSSPIRFGAISLACAYRPGPPARLRS